MLAIVVNVKIDTQVTYQIKWRWNEKGLFTMHSFYTWLSNGGVFNSDYDVLWKSHIPFKIQIFLWLIRKNKIFTRVKKGWNGCITCLFCEQDEIIEHLFVQCPYVNSIWQWLARYNNFVFTGTTLDDIWMLDAFIPFKNKVVMEMIRGVVMWII
jgi:zinc-binding in reverse transcriptase